MEINNIVSIINSKKHNLDFVIGGVKYRFFEKGDLLYSSDEYDYEARTTGIYMEADQNRWILYDDHISTLFELGNVMTDDEHTILCANLTLNQINRKER